MSAVQLWLAERNKETTMMVCDLYMNIFPGTYLTQPVSLW